VEIEERSMFERKKKDEVLLGSWLSLGSPYVAEIMARSGFQWLAIDMEHSAANALDAVQRQIQVIDLAGCVPLVRVPNNDETVIKQVLDAGAHGVIVPSVNTPDQAERAVKAAHYPPDGSRGVGLWRAQAYGRRFEDYREGLGQNAAVLVQIEHKQAVQGLEAILAVQGVAGFIIGPYDLSASYGAPGDFESPTMRDALEKVSDTARSTDKWSGIHVVQPDPAEVRARLADGYNLIAYGVDFTFLTHAIDRDLEELRAMKSFHLPEGNRD
jgi:2-keto-3-deoxy-L-rhamnonate aldolase RhmA